MLFRKHYYFRKYFTIQHICEEQSHKQTTPGFEKEK